ncbi:MAG: ABC transporter permease [Chloroflexi bacterium RBG_13_53_26]|jgi:branched-chain amino acid transport system permease protein|nr:MAG: ABC transporter permease [Chloroflexi bacterium RBG_13_53_26]
MSADQFLQYLVSGLTQGSIYALVGLGFTIIYAVTRIINFAQGEFVMLGGMLSFTLIASVGIPIVPALVLSVLVAAAVGGVLYLLAIRPARRASVASLIIITIGAAIFIRGIASELWGVDAVRPPSFTGDSSIQFLGAYIHPQALWIIGTTVVVTVILQLFLSYTIVGKALNACAINPAAARLVGINPAAMGLVAFILAASLGGIAGVVMAPLTLTSYHVGVMLGLKGFVAASIGGFKSPLAAVVGGITLGIVESLAVGLDWGPFTSAYKDAIALVVLLVILLARAGKLAAEERVS